MFVSSHMLLMAGTAGDYQNKCANCHGAHAKKAALGKSAAIAGKSANRLIRDLEGYKAGVLNKKGMGGLMKAQVKQLSTKEIKAMARYLSSLPR